MGWAQPHELGTGTCQQIEDAHVALDKIGVPSGVLAIRVLELIKMHFKEHNNDHR